MGNSIIEAQITLKEEQEKEIERCKDLHYFYTNIDRKPVFWDTDKAYFDFIKKINDDKNIIGIINLKTRVKL